MDFHSDGVKYYKKSRQYKNKAKVNLNWIIILSHKPIVYNKKIKNTTTISCKAVAKQKDEKQIKIMNWQTDKVSYRADVLNQEKQSKKN